MSSWLLASCYRINGIEYGHYHHLVRSLLGRNPAIVCSVIQLINMVLVCIAYTITAGMSLVEIAQEICILNGEDVESSKCFSNDTGGEWKMTLIFGAAIIPLTCLVPSLEEAWWTSAMGTIGAALGYLTLFLYDNFSPEITISLIVKCTLYYIMC